MWSFEIVNWAWHSPSGAVERLGAQSVRQPLNGGNLGEVVTLAEAEDGPGLALLGAFFGFFWRTRSVVNFRSNPLSVLVNLMFSRIDW